MPAPRAPMPKPSKAAAMAPAGAYPARTSAPKSLSTYQAEGTQ